MVHKTTRVICNSHLGDEHRPPLVLTDAALLEIDSDDAPLLTLTAAAHKELEDDGKRATATVLLAALASPSMQLLFAERFKEAYCVYADYEAAVGFNNVQAKSKAFSEASEALFFQLKAMFELSIRAGL